MTVGSWDTVRTGFGSGGSTAVDGLDYRFDLVRSSYVDQVSSEQLMDGAFSGVTDAIDEFSYYVPAAQYDLAMSVAGTAPAVSRTAASEAVATSMFCGYGRPWLINVDSRATTGRPSAMAATTSGAMTRRSRTDARTCGTGIPEA